MKSPFKLPYARRPGFDTLYRALKDADKKPYIGYSQGGSSRKDRGARVAARDVGVKQPAASVPQPKGDYHG